MGTSGTNPGNKGNKPLVPSWLMDPVDQVDEPGAENTPQSDNPQFDASRYTAARTNFTNFVKSGGKNKRALRKSVSSYVRRSSGGAKNATAKMSPSRKTATKLLGFLQEASNQGLNATLKLINLENLVGRPIDEIFIGILDLFCPEGGQTDAGLARDSLIKTLYKIEDEYDASDLDNLNVDQIQTILEIYIAHSIEDKLINEIGINSIFQTQTTDDVDLIQEQLNDFIRNSVKDALGNSQTDITKIEANKIGKFVDDIYEQTFTLLSSLYEESSE